jgi:hypothetical protein
MTAMMRGLAALAIAGAVGGLTATPALADDFHHDEHHGPHGRGRAAPGPWWHGDIHQFHEHDVNIWRGGRWYHGRHGGRSGWWWIVGGIWYFYPAPVYPYPDPYVPPVVVAPPQTYYWCANPPGYYPQVPTCAVPWQAVPANAPPPG